MLTSYELMLRVVQQRASHYYAMQNLEEMNSSLARVIRRNLPDDGSGEIIAVYHNQYDWLMPNLR